MDQTAAALISVALGIGLAAATGLRVFLPLLVAAFAAHWGVLPLGNGFGWLASTTAIAMLGTASVVEILAYYVPGVDHALDLIAGPATLAAGTVASASVMVDLPPWVVWPVAIIAGGGMAGLTKGTTAVVRATSNVATLGLASPVISTIETLGATGVAVLAIAVPILALVVIGGALYLLYRLAHAAGRLVSGPER